MQEKGYIFDLVDFSSIRTEIAKNVFRIPNVFNREIDGNQYNLICLWQVIEHVPNPVGYLSDIIKNISDEKCHIFIATPNTTSFGAKYFRSKWKHFVSHHISLFSPTSISVLLERVGLKLLNIDENRMYSTKKSSIARSLIRHGVRLILFKKSNLRAFETDGLCVHGYKIDNK